MINVHYTFTDALHRLEITGHAEYNNGNDIVCAAVSAITYTLAGFLHNTDCHSFVRLDSGDGEMHCYRTPRTDVAIEMAMLGYFQIAASYPNNVTIHISTASCG